MEHRKYDLCGSFKPVKANNGNIVKTAYYKRVSTVFEGTTIKVPISQSYNYKVVPQFINAAENASGKGTVVWSKSASVKALQNISYELASSTITDVYFTLQEYILPY